MMSETESTSSFIFETHNNQNTYSIRMTKQKLTLAINQDLLKKVKDSKINISSFLEIRLQEHMALVEGVSVRNGDECGRRDLNPSFKLGKLK